MPGREAACFKAWWAGQKREPGTGAPAAGGTEIDVQQLGLSNADIKEITAGNV